MELYLETRNDHGAKRMKAKGEASCIQEVVNLEVVIEVVVEAVRDTPGMLGILYKYLSLGETIGTARLTNVTVAFKIFEHLSQTIITCCSMRPIDIPPPINKVKPR